MSAIKPFQNEEDAIAIGDLAIENRLDRIEVYGSLKITKDKTGLALAKELKILVDNTIKALQSEDLPDHIEFVAPDRVENPFK